MPTAHCRAVVTWPDTTGDPANHTVNVWHFTCDDASLAVNAGEFHLYMNSVYNSFSQMFTKSFNRTAGLAQYFRLEDPRPRLPFLEVPMTMSAMTDPNRQDAPHELAVAVSYGGDLVSGDVKARKRGRLYLGPWTYQASPALDLTHVPNAQQDAIVASFDTFLAQSLSNPLFEWCVYSRYTHGGLAVGEHPPPGESFPETPSFLSAAFEPVRWVYVDNEWDIQRRRGLTYTRRVFAPSGSQGTRTFKRIDTLPS